MITLNLVESYWRSHSENSNDETSPLSISRASTLSLNYKSNYKSALTKNIHIVKKSVRQIFGKVIKCKIWPISKIAQILSSRFFFSNFDSKCDSP